MITNRFEGAGLRDFILFPPVLLPWLWLLLYYLQLGRMKPPRSDAYQYMLVSVACLLGLLRIYRSLREGREICHHIEMTYVMRVPSQK